MNRLRHAAMRAAQDLDAVECSWALVGGLAVAARAEPRLTRDVDFVVAVEDDHGAESVIRALRSHGWRVLAVLEHTPTGRLATTRMALSEPSARGIVVDLLFSTTGIEREIVLAAEELTIPSLGVMRVASTEHLLAMKLLAYDARDRPMDHDDVMALLHVADDAELRRAEEALQLIAERGFHRDRDLPALFAELRASFREHGSLNPF